MPTDNQHLEVDLPRLREICNAALASDCLDAIGYTKQVLAADINLISGQGVAIGYAFPVRLEIVDAFPDVPYIGLLKALDAVGKDDVYIIPTGRTGLAALWGELLSYACAYKGVVAAITDGPVRDTSRMRAMEFKVFGVGTNPIDINGRYEVVAHNVACEIDGVTINPGDLIVADLDGVVVVPKSQIAEVVRRVEEKNSGENLFRDAVKKGMSPTEAFATYGVL